MGVKDVLGPFCILITLNIIVLVAWTAYSPLKWERTIEVYDSYGRPSQSSGSCHSDHTAAFLSSLFSINAIALIYALVEAYQARNITTEFSESTHIAQAMVCICESLFVGVPVLVIVSGSPTAEMFVQTAIVFIIVASLLLLMFVPKILSMKRGAEARPNSCPTCGKNQRGTSQQSQRWGLQSGTQLSSRLGLQGTQQLSGLELQGAQQSSRWGLHETQTTSNPKADQLATNFEHQPSTKFEPQPSTEISADDRSTKKSFCAAGKPAPSTTTTIQLTKFEQQPSGSEHQLIACPSSRNTSLSSPSKNKKVSFAFKNSTNTATLDPDRNTL